ncbi:conserved protein of unknown function [Candidatus Nitrosacidococcus tergens]|uniref:Uncharacterized protein n=1 Tax=Candidatus Nitrosacidococcus tergens TaxID=553981 RepID=A0A7G1QAG9_9GAMM|nr:hypothetical protein [Candidatus Nitrosacidococcus tergens]CAB1276462.1 conserved protein of unknown function [Candidatus Nitrosacidococcus tergens]
MPEDVTKTLKFFTGEIPPIKSNCQDKRRMLLNEMNEEDQNKIVNCFKYFKLIIMLGHMKQQKSYAKESLMKWM